MLSFLFHSDLSVLDNIVFLLNALGAGAAWWYNRKAYLNTAINFRLRRLFFIIEGLSAAYFLAYISLLIFNLNVANWGPQ